VTSLPPPNPNINTRHIFYYLHVLSQTYAETSTQRGKIENTGKESEKKKKKKKMNTTGVNN